MDDTIWTTKRIFDSVYWSGVTSPRCHFADSTSKIVMNGKGVQVQAHVVTIVRFEDPTLRYSIEVVGESVSTGEINPEFYTPWQIIRVDGHEFVIEKRTIPK